MAKKNKHRLRKVLLILAALAATPVALTALYIAVPPPLTPLMVQRLFQGEGLHKDWTPLTQISPAVTYSVIAGEDNLFCQHNGFDWKALQKAYDTWQAAQILDDDEARIKGGSTISQQTAKNLFLLPVQSAARKALEIPLTVVLETFLTKRRIIELYLNIAEWGHGIYGVQAASQHYFHTDASKLTWRQGAQLAAILPSPRRWPINGSYALTRAGHIQGRVSQLGPLLDCVRGKGGIYPPQAKRATPVACPNCPKSKPPASVSNPPSSVPDLPPLPSAIPNSANPSQQTLPPEPLAPSSPDWNAVPSTSSSGLAPATPSCSTSECLEGSPSSPTPPQPEPQQQQLQPMIPTDQATPPANQPPTEQPAAQ